MNLGLLVLERVGAPGWNGGSLTNFELFGEANVSWQGTSWTGKVPSQTPFTECLYGRLAPAAALHGSPVGLQMAVQ